MSTRMLIDARHPEETRVTVVKGSRVEDFDYESATRRQLKGNIYLARVTRVEPSLQAAFVEYGGNRHGFLAFSEIHPDYYQIPLEDREAIIEEETRAAAAEKAAEDDEEADAKKRRPRRRRGRKPAAEAVENSDATVSEDAPESTPLLAEATKTEGTDTDTSSAASDGIDVIEDAEAPEEKGPNADAVTDAEDADADVDTEVKESADDEKDAEEEAAAAASRRNVRALKRRYSIQEVIKRRQVLLIQVVKEERGNKGAALTTYMSLAGRYCVLMPNSTHSGGISRKISNISDRKKLKQVINSLEVPEGMGLIVRTAGINRTKAEIKRDYDYLLRLWNGIRDLTLKSTAPALIYEEGSLIKRTIRDVYTRDIDEVWVEGERGYRAAKDFMKLLMPSHAKKVQHYKDRIPLYQRYQVESQLEAMYQPVVQLKSGGYIVINPTEALISIDVNSGRATKEHNIEETAVKTNLEAAEEVARQLRLRDMAGLVVIDYIDMEDSRNNRAVERRMKDMLKGDRARIQVGRISSFGLMEMSRQRLRPNLLEVAMETCSHCEGTGLIRSVESAAIMALRQLEEEGIRNRSSLIRAKVSPEVAVYLLNQKRAVLSGLEQDYKVTIHIIAEVSLAPSTIEITHEANIEATSEPRSEGVVVKMDTHGPEAEDSEEDGSEDDSSATSSSTENEREEKAADDQDDQPRKKRRRRRRRRRGGSDDPDASQSQGDTRNNETSNVDSEAKSVSENDGETDSENDAKNDDKAETASRRRRGSRGGRRRRSRDGAQDTRSESVTESADVTTDTAGAPAAETGGEQPNSDAVTPQITDGISSDTDVKNDTDARPVRRRRRTRKPAENQAENATPTEASPEPAAADSTASTDEEKRPAKRAPRRRAPARSRSKNTDSDTGATETSAKDTAETAGEPVSKDKTSSKSTSDVNVTAPSTDNSTETPSAPKPRGRRRAPARATAKSDNKETAANAEPDADASAAEKPKARRAPAKKANNKAETAKTDTSVKADASQPKSATPDAAEPAGPKKSGWWQRTFG